ncbi:MAG: SH3 domain-containing protein [Clostridia bacterium]|nr:SH3 domain-containing protein [Clostridia bacterium]
MAKQNGFQKFLRKMIPVVDGIIEKVKKMDRRFLIMIAASVVLLIVILSLIIHSVSSNKSDEDEIPSSPPSYIQEEPSTDDEPVAGTIVAVGAGSYKVDTGSTSDLNMRPTAGKEYGAMGAIPNGTQVNVLFVDDSGDISWGYVEYNGKRGWVSMDYLVPVAG